MVRLWDKFINWLHLITVIELVLLTCPSSSLINLCKSKCSLFFLILKALTGHPNNDHKLNQSIISYKDERGKEVRAMIFYCTEHWRMQISCKIVSIHIIAFYASVLPFIHCSSHEERNMYGSIKKLNDKKLQGKLNYFTFFVQSASRRGQKKEN